MTEQKRNQIITIPNLLSLVRLLLIPVFIHLYANQQAYGAAVLVLVISGLTDVVDGFIARRFNMISDIGKILDPIADKLTQFAALLCLIKRFPAMLLPAILMVIKEILAAVTGLYAIRRSGTVPSADWHGKVTTVLLYTTIAVHILWISIPEWASGLLIGLSVAMMLCSLVLYLLRNRKLAATRK